MLSLLYASYFLKPQLFLCVQGQRNLFPFPHCCSSLLPFTMLGMGVSFVIVPPSLLIFFCHSFNFWLFRSYSVSPHFFRRNCSINRCNGVFHWGDELRVFLYCHLGPEPISEFPILFHWSICSPAHNHTVFITVALSYVLNSGDVSSLPLFFNVVLAVLCLLPCNTNVRISLSIYMKWCVGILIIV